MRCVTQTAAALERLLPGDMRREQKIHRVGTAIGWRLGHSASRGTRASA